MMMSDGIEPGDDYDANVVKIVAVMDALDGLWRAYNELPELSRQALLLQRLGSMREEEVAVQLGIDICAVERSITTAIEHLQKAQFRTKAS